MTTLKLADLVAVVEVSKNCYESQTLPQRLGNLAPIAYGGFTMAFAVHSAHKTVANPKMHMYSMLGSFHGPTRIDRLAKCRVEHTRDTKTFATRRVIAYQTQDDGSERACADMLIDFHVLEPGMFAYSAPASPVYDGVRPEEGSTGASLSTISAEATRTVTNSTTGTITRSARITQLVQDKHVSEAEASAHLAHYSMIQAMFETQHCLAGVSAQNVGGLAKHLPTTQDHLALHDKTSADWIRTRQELLTQAENFAALAFNMDGALNSLPLDFDHKSLTDAGACSTLDFALRVLVPDVHMERWHLKERKTVAAGHARTYSEAKLWDEHGTMVAIMTQTSICRPPASASGPIAGDRARL